MLDIQFIRENSELVREKSKQKGYDIDVQQLLGFDVKRRELQQEVEALRRERNEIAESMKGQRPSDDQVAKGREVKEKLVDLEHRFAAIDKEFLDLLKQVPNMPLDDVPVGATEEENVVAKTVGEIPNFDFEPKTHAQIAEAKGWLDKERAAKIAGSRFAYLKGDLVHLQFAIVQWVMQTLTNQTIIREIIDNAGLEVSDKPFVPVIPPAMVRTAPYEATARLDREEVTYKIEQDDLWLNASAEHSLVPMYMDEVLLSADLPIRYIGYSTSFRREAGTYGKDMEGMFRMHQFDKLEMECFTDAASGYNEHKFLVAIQEYFTRQLGISYRVLQKCTADIGFANAAGVDIEMWLPGQGKYRETHSADYMTDYQTRRLRTRVRASEDGGLTLAQTNDATALVLSRTPVAIIENYQTAEGDVIVPEVLRPYMGGRERI
jgi:seryl-tRNA synthetase